MKPGTYRETIFKASATGTTPQEIQQMLRRHVWFPRRIGIQRQFLSIFDPMPEIVARLNEFQPDVIDANGSYLALLFGYLHKSGAACHLPKVVTYSSESVSEPIRRLILDEFHLPVLSAYQTTEAFKVGWECDRHTGYHLNIDLYPLRLIDPEGRTLPAGEPGEARGFPPRPGPSAKTNPGPSPWPPAVDPGGPRPQPPAL